MRALALAAAGAALLAGCAPGGPSARGNRLDLGGPRERDFVTANPSAVIAAELEFARAAREDGTWTAFREYSTADALWPAPALSNVRRDLAGTPDPAEAIVWGPDAVWVSCDGSFALSTGPATYPNGRRSRFATIWRWMNSMLPTSRPRVGWSRMSVLRSRLNSRATTAFC